MSYGVLGANGQIGRLLTQELCARGQEVVAVARNWRTQPWGPGVQYRSADARRQEQLEEALAGCSTVYSVLGLPYRAEVWETQWAPMMTSVLGATLHHGARLVYLDNVYCYGPVDGWMTEATPDRPTTRLGRVRAQVAQLLLDAVAKQDARVVIARSADFVGPGGDLSIAGARLFAGVIGKTSARRGVEWLGDPKTRHCWNGTPSVCSALALLGSADEADFGQVWHLPTYGPMTGFEFCSALGTVCNCTVRPRRVTAGALRVVGLWNPLARASAEMLYQSTNDYLFSDQKFRARFAGFDQGPFTELLATTVKYFAGQRR